MRHLVSRHINYSFNVRLVIVFVSFTLCSALALNYYFYDKVRDELQNDLVAHGQSMTRLLANSCTLGVFTNNKQDLQGPAGIICQENNCRKVIIFDGEGTPLLSLAKKRTTNETKLSSAPIYDQVSQPSTKNISFYPQRHEILFGQAIFAGQTYDDEDLFWDTAQSPPTAKQNVNQPPIGYVAILLSTNEMTTKIRNILLNNLIISLLIIVVSSAGIFFFVVRLTKPLEKLAHEIIKHKTDKSSNCPAELTGNFSEMIDIIQDSYRTIQELKNNLENKVLERTQDLDLQRHNLEVANSDLANTLAQLQRAQQQIVQTEKMASLGLMVSGLSHEIKNSVNFISASLPLLTENLQEEFNGEAIAPASAAKRRKNTATLLANINEGVKRTVAVIEDLGRFSHQGTDDFKVTDILPGLKSSVAIIKREYKSHLDFQEDYSCSHCIIWGNHNQTNQVFMNLLLNAVQSIEQTGTIMVSARHEQGKALIEIKDSGPGIDPRIKDKLFDPFFTTKDVGMGSGLGLSISYSIIKKHGGEIIVDNNPGGGAVFTIILPLKENSL